MLKYWNHNVVLFLNKMYLTIEELISDIQFVPTESNCEFCSQIFNRIGNVLSNLSANSHIAAKEDNSYLCNKYIK
jgi:hypothetical protein